MHVRDLPNKELIKEVRFGVDFGWTNPTALVVVAYDGDGRVWVLDEFYKSQVGVKELIGVSKAFILKYGNGEFLCDRSEPQSIVNLQMAGFRAKDYEFKREDGLKELGARFPKAGDGLPRIFIARHCVNLISELLEYKVEAKERDHAVDALRYALKLKPALPPLRAFRFG